MQFVDKVIVEDTKTKAVWYALLGRWLDPEQVRTRLLIAHVNHSP
jgi:hypothetical protein